MHIHKWTKWHAPVAVQMVYLRSGVKFYGVEHHQKRECRRCGKVQEREVNNY